MHRRSPMVPSGRGIAASRRRTPLSLGWGSALSCCCCWGPASRRPHRAKSLRGRHRRRHTPIWQASRPGHFRYRSRNAARSATSSPPSGERHTQGGRAGLRRRPRPCSTARTGGGFSRQPSGAAGWAAGRRCQRGAGLRGQQLQRCAGPGESCGNSCFDWDGGAGSSRAELVGAGARPRVAPDEPPAAVPAVAP